MKTIGVLIPTFTIDYSLDILSGISDFFRDRDVQVIIAQTKVPHKIQGAFDYQYSTSIEYLKAKDVDAIIVASGVYTASMSHEDFTKMIKSFGNRPVISIGTTLKLKNVKTIIADCKKTYFYVVKHLKEVHGCKNIAFFSASSTGSEEAIQRYDAFKAAMSSNKLSLNQDWVYEGYFTDFAAYDIIKKAFKKREDIPFDAIVCSNDMMAYGCLRAFSEIGAIVPDDVKVIGFDDSVVAATSKPRLSTINQDIYNQGFEAAELTYRILNGESVDKETKIPLSPRFRQSCGCIDCKSSLNIYKNSYGEECLESGNAAEAAFRFANEMTEKNNIITLMDTANGSHTLKQIFYTFKYIAQQCDFSTIAVNFSKEIAFIDSYDEFKVPKEVELSILVEPSTNLELFRPGVFFDPSEKLIAARSMQAQSGIFLLNPIYTGETNYGYILCKINGNKFADYNVYLKIIVTAIAQTYEYSSKLTETQKLITENSTLTLQSRTDEMTGVLNRRGFIEKGQEALDMLQETDTAGLIFFVDMDGLKKINDTYGHEMGDKAIKAQAKVLKSVFRSTDVVGRLGGDEFGVVAIGMKLPYVDSVRLKIDMMCKKVSQEENLPFTVSVSLGAVDLQASSVLKKLLTEADTELYKEKRKKHEGIS